MHELEPSNCNIGYTGPIRRILTTKPLTAHTTSTNHKLSAYTPHISITLSIALMPPKIHIRKPKRKTFFTTCLEDNYFTPSPIVTITHLDYPTHYDNAFIPHIRSPHASTP